MNGLDTGSLGNSTWYYIYLIAKADGTIAGLMSTSSSAPTMPSGYTYKALLGAIITNGSAQFIKYTQFDNKAYRAKVNVLNNAKATTDGTFQSLNISSAVPPIAQTVSGFYGSSLTGNGCNISVAGDANGVGEQYFFDPASNTSSANSYFVAGNFRDIPLITAQTIYWTVFLGTNLNNRIDISGWTYGG